MNKPLIINVTLNATIDKVWNALTDIYEMRQWFFEIDEFEPQVGFVFTFWAGSDDKNYLHICKVQKVDFLKEISYSWCYNNIIGDSVVTFKLTSKGNVTDLELNHKGVHTFPQNNPDFTIESFIYGWNEIIGVYLKEYLEQDE